MQGNFIFPTQIELKNIVRYFFQTKGDVSMRQIILPQGCIELIFNFEEENKINASLNGEMSVLNRCFISGFNTRPKFINHGEHQNYFGLIIHPSAIRHLLGVNGMELANKYIDLTLINNEFNSLWHQLYEKPIFHDRVKFISEWIIKQKITLQPRELMLNAFLNGSSSSNISVSNLANELCYSSRQLTRKMVEITGMNSEQFLSYQKFLQSVVLIHTSDLSMTEIAYKCHFADQSHFSNSFKTYAQLSPKEYSKIKSQIPGHYFEDVR